MLNIWSVLFDEHHRREWARTDGSRPVAVGMVWFLRDEIIDAINAILSSLTASKVHFRGTDLYV